MFIKCCFVILISFCEIRYVNCFGDINIKVFYENNTYVPYDKNVALSYNEGEKVQLRCIISQFAFGDDKSSRLTWLDDNGNEYLSESKPSLELNMTLTDAQDGLKLVCKAVTKYKTLSLSLHFIRNKSETKKPTIFLILIISICGFVGGTFIILITWSLISRLCKAKVKECDTQVIFSEDLNDTQNNLTLESRNTEITEMGISNQSEDLQNGAIENDIDRREDIDSDRKDDFRQNSLYITVEECKRHGSSTEC